MGHDAVRADDHVVADPQPGVDVDVASDPHIVADHDIRPLRGLLPRVAELRDPRIVRGPDVNTVCDPAASPDGDASFGGVARDVAMVAKVGPFAHRDDAVAEEQRPLAPANARMEIVAGPDERRVVLALAALQV